MSYQPRIPTSFSSRDGLTSVTFGLAEYEWESTQELYAPEAQLVGAHYTFDQLGTAAAKKQAAFETLRFVVYEDTPAEVDTEIDELCAKCVSIGLGKLWMTAADGSLRWAYARALSLPALRWSAGDNFRKAVSLRFRRQSDWYDQAQTTVTTPVNEVSEGFTISNTTGQDILGPVLTLYGVWSGTVTILNNTNGYGIVYTGAAGASNNDRVRFDAAANRVDRSADGGVTWTSDYSNFARYSTAQVQQMILKTGDNNFIVTSTGPNATLLTQYYPPH